MSHDYKYEPDTFKKYKKKYISPNETFIFTEIVSLETCCCYSVSCVILLLCYGYTAILKVLFKYRSLWKIAEVNYMIRAKTVISLFHQQTIYLNRLYNTSVPCCTCKDCQVSTSQTCLFLRKKKKKTERKRKKHYIFLHSPQRSS